MPTSLSHTWNQPQQDEPAAGLFVPFKLGLTKEAELLNGRLAMVLAYILCR